MIKWIGQHIWDFVSRFRNDIYMESIPDGTIASGKNLGLDTNNKVVKSASPSGSIDLTSEVTGTLPVGSGGTGADTLADNSILTGTGTSAITAESNLTFDGSDLTLDGNLVNSSTGDMSGFGEVSALDYIGQTVVLTSSTTGKPQIKLINSNTDAVSPTIEFQKTATGADDDNLGMIQFKGDDEGNGVHSFADVLAQIADATPGEEAGKLSFRVAEYDGTLTTGILINGDTNADGEVDVTIGAGAASTTTIAGTLTMGSTAFVNNSGVVQVATQGTIDHNSLANAGGNQHIDWTSASAGTIHATNYTNTNQLTEFVLEDDSGDEVTISHGKEVKFIGAGGLTIDWTNVSNGTDADPYDLTFTIGTLNQSTTGNAATATALATARAFQTNLGSTSSADFDGTAANTHGVTGTLAVGNGGTGVTSLTSLKDALDDETWSFANNVTLTGFVLDGNTITGVNDSDEFDDDDAHIMTSAAVQDKILSYGYSTTTGTVTSVGTTTGLSGTVTSSGNLSLALGDLADMTQSWVTAEDEFIVLDNGTQKRKLSSEIFGSNAFTSTTIGTTTNALTFDDTTVQLNTGTTFDGSAARTVSAKTAAVSSGSDALATGDQIYNFVDSTVAPYLHAAVTLAGSLDYITISGQEITRNAIDLTTDVTGVLPSANLDADTAHLTTDQTFTGVKQINKRKFALTSSSTHGDAIGDVIYIGLNTGGTATEAGKIYYYRSNGYWSEADADTEVSAKGLLAVALGSDPDADGMLLRGTVTLALEIGGTEALGSVLYLDDQQAAGATVTIPTDTDHIVRVIGYSLSTDDDMIYFNPDNTWIKLS